MTTKRFFLFLTILLSIFFVKVNASILEIEQYEFVFDEQEESLSALDSYYINYFDGLPLFNRNNASKYIDQYYVMDSFEAYMLKKPFPTTDEFIVFLQEILSNKCYSNNLYDKCHMQYYRHALDVLRQNNRIDNLFYLIVDDRIRNYKPNFKDLSKYLKSLNVLYRKRIKEYDQQEHPIYDLSFLNSGNLRQKIGGYKGITPRQALYLKYDSYQIKYLAYQLKKMLNVMKSNNAYIHVDMQDDDVDDIHLVLSYTEKYRLGVKLLKFHLKDLQFDSRFGITPLYIDVLLAGVETGVIKPDILKIMYNMPELYDSYRNRFNSYREVLKRLGKQVLINTPVVGQLAFIPIMIIEIRNEMRNAARGNSNDTHLF